VLKGKKDWCSLKIIIPLNALVWIRIKCTAGCKMEQQAYSPKGAISPSSDLGAFENVYIHTVKITSRERLSLQTFSNVIDSICKIWV